jgi:hypothetical protein
MNTAPILVALAATLVTTAVAAPASANYSARDTRLSATVVSTTMPHGLWSPYAEPVTALQDRTLAQYLADHMAYRVSALD